MKVDYGPMALHEANALKGDLFTTKNQVYKEASVEGANAKGRVIDLVLPIIVLIICCIIGMIYSAGIFSGVDL